MLLTNHPLERRERASFFCQRIIQHTFSLLSPVFLRDAFFVVLVLAEDFRILLRGMSGTKNIIKELGKWGGKLFGSLFSREGGERKREAREKHDVTGLAFAFVTETRKVQAHVFRSISESETAFQTWISLLSNFLPSSLFELDCLFSADWYFQLPLPLLLALRPCV